MNTNYGKNSKQKSDDKIVREFIRNMENKTQDPAFWLESKKIKIIDDLPRKYPLTNEEKVMLPEKYTRYISIQQDAIQIVKKYVNQFSNSPEYKIIVEDLKNGLNVLEVGLSKDVEKGIDGFLADLERFPKGRRPGFGISRGFGEFLWQGYDWQKEIMDSVPQYTT